jgi:hypothetical protein
MNESLEKTQGFDSEQIRKIGTYAAMVLIHPNGDISEVDEEGMDNVKVRLPEIVREVIMDLLKREDPALQKEVEEAAFAAYRYQIRHSFELDDAVGKRMMEIWKNLDKEQEAILKAFSEGF